jgi:hemerythrin-like domain-containing protein
MTTPTEHHTHIPSCYWDIEQARWSCPDSTLDVAPVRLPRRERPLVDVRDMLVVHTAMLREFRLAPDAVRRVPVGDTRQTGVVARHLHFLTDLLHHHHQGEDDLLWPVLRARTSSQTAQVIDEVESQHAALDRELATVEHLRATWADDPSARTRDELAHHVAQLHSLLRDHLELEERALLPLAAAVLTEAEWHAIGEAGVAEMRKSTLPLAFGMFAYEGDPAVLGDMLSAAPRIARVVLPVIAGRAYARRARRVHGTTHP